MTDNEKELLALQEAFLLDVSEEIYRVMQEKRISKAALALLLCSSKPNVTQLLDGTRNMRLRTLAEVCFHLGVKPHFELKRRIETSECVCFDKDGKPLNQCNECPR